MGVMAVSFPGCDIPSNAVNRLETEKQESTAKQHCWPMITPSHHPERHQPLHCVPLCPAAVVGCHLGGDDHQHAGQKTGTGRHPEGLPEAPTAARVQCTGRARPSAVSTKNPAGYGPFCAGDDGKASQISAPRVLLHLRCLYVAGSFCWSWWLQCGEKAPYPNNLPGRLVHQPNSRTATPYAQ